MAGLTGAIGAAIAVYQRTSRAVLFDAVIWQQEARNPDRRLLQWPRPAEGTQSDRLLSVLFNADVDVLLYLFEDEGDARMPTWPPDVHDPKMQVLLRVQRSMDVGWRAMVAGFGGLELSGWRRYKNEVMASLSELALRSGLPRDDAFAALGIGRRQGFRSLKRSANTKGARRK